MPLKVAVNQVKPLSQPRQQILNHEPEECLRENVFVFLFASSLFMSVSQRMGEIHPLYCTLFFWFFVFLVVRINRLHDTWK